MARMNPGKLHFGRYGEAFRECAAIQNIDLQIRQAEARRRAIDREIAWLTEVRDYRQAQLDAGTWPPKQDEVVQ